VRYLYSGTLDPASLGDSDVVFVLLQLADEYLVSDLKVRSLNYAHRHRRHRR
jgi:phosphopantetheine adenylyltransferase